MSTLEHTDVDTIEELDFEPPCSCKDCDHAAQHSARCKGCSHVRLLCDSHLRALREKLGSLLVTRVGCTRCGTSAASLDELIEVTAL